MNARLLIGLLSAIALLATAGTALAAQGPSPRADRCEARLEAAAARQGISVEQLEARIEARLLARVDAALRAGRITRARAENLRARIVAADHPCPRARAVVRVALARRPLLRRAAAYLALTRAELRSSLPGTSLAALAAAQGKSVDGLEAAMLAPAEARLDRAVARGRIRQARADRILALLERRVERLVQKVFPAR